MVDVLHGVDELVRAEPVPVNRQTWFARSAETVLEARVALEALHPTRLLPSPSSLASTSMGVAWLRGTVTGPSARAVATMYCTHWPMQTSAVSEGRFWLSLSRYVKVSRLRSGGLVQLEDQAAVPQGSGEGARFGRVHDDHRRQVARGVGVVGQHVDEDRLSDQIGKRLEDLVVERGRSLGERRRAGG